MIYYDITIGYKGGAVVELKGVKSFKVEGDPVHKLAWTNTPLGQPLHINVNEIIHVHARIRLRPFLWTWAILHKAIRKCKFW